MSKHNAKETGHMNILLATLLACIGLIILTIGGVRGNTTMIWIGGIGAAVMLLAQFGLVHNEIGNLWRRINEIEERKKQ